MIWIYFLLAILFIILFMLLLPIHVIIKYAEELTIKVKIFGLNFTVYSSQNDDEENIPESKPENKNKKSGNFISKIIKKRGLSGAARIFGKLLKELGGAAVKILKHISINKLDIDVHIASEDAAATAITYGQACAAIYGTVGFLTAVRMPKSYKVNVAPDFLKTKPYFKLNLDVHARSWYLIYIAFSMVKKYTEII